MKYCRFKLMVPSSIHESREVISPRDYLMDKVLLSMWAVPRGTVSCSCYSDIAWDFADLVFCSLLDKSENPNDHWDSCCFHSPRAFSRFQSQDLCTEFFHSFWGGVPCCGDRHINKLTGSFLLVFHQHVWSVCFYLFVSLDWYVPKYSGRLVVCHISWFILVVFILYFDVMVFVYCPVEICCSFIVLYVLCLGKLAHDQRYLRVFSLL